jgi:hypothetical protein
MTLFALALALPVTALIWYPDWVWPAYVVAAPLAVYAFVRAATQPPKVKPGWTRARRSQTRWLPGFGIGVSLFHWPPRLYAFLALWRWRR